MTLANGNSETTRGINVMDLVEGVDSEDTLCVDDEICWCRSKDRRKRDKLR